MVEKNKLIVVLGMHRSGTSAITRGLKVIGVELGDNLLNPVAEDNKTGYWEDFDIQTLNIEMLSVIENDWHYLTPIQATDIEVLREKGYFLRAVELLRQKMDDAPVFGFKDPRVAKLFLFWKEVFSQFQLDVSYVLTLRHPLSVAKSLAKRNGFDTEKSYLLWLGHVIASLSGTVGEKCVLIDYDRLMQSPDFELNRIAKQLDLEIRPAELKIYKSEFLNDGLRHTLYDLNALLLDKACPPLVREIYVTLLDVALDKKKIDDSSLQKKVNIWANEFGRLKSTLAIVDRLSIKNMAVTHSVVEREGQIASLNHTIIAYEGQLASINQVVLEREQQIASLNHTLTERDGQIASLSHNLTELDEQIASLSHNLTELDEQIARLSHTLTERDRQITRLSDKARNIEMDLTIKNQQIVVLQNENASTHRKIASLNSSYSWRLTWPLRVVGAFLKKAFNNFDAAWYLKQNPDVAMSGLDPYEHYVKFGKAEGRQPAPDLILPPNITKAQYIVRIARRSIRRSVFGIIGFCYRCLPFSPRQRKLIEEFCFKHLSLFYRGVPSYEFWLSRRATGAPHFLSNNDFVLEGVDWSLMLPETATQSSQETVPQSVVDIVIPVYRSLEQTRRCINSVLNSTVRTPFRLIAINDASPDVEVAEYLRSLPSSQRVIVVENAANLGFTATVNRGMTWSDKNDVLLLNSDAEVANDWLDKLKAQAYSGPRVGSVTPFSNNATICNYPTLDGMKELPAGESVGSLDAAFASANMGRNIEIPTAVGFCMYIRRDCLNEVGLFDVETFGKGYGEENDFCLRATIRGWKHLLAADTFVCHAGEVSFKEGSNHGKERGMKILRNRYPNYEADVAKHVAKNEAYPLRVAATAARFRQSNVPVVLHVLHPYGGGTEKHVEELCRNHYSKAKLLIMTPPFLETGETALRIHSADPVDALDIHLPVSNLDLDYLASLIQSFGVSLVHIHHVLGYPFNLQYLVEKLGVPFYLTIHDYTLICPRINLMPLGQKYCGEPEPSTCNQCLSADYPHGAGDIVWWREGHAWLFNDASAVICPSNDVAQRCRRYFPEAVYRVVAHEKAPGDSYLDINVPVLNKNEQLRVAILGVLARHKGLELIAETLLIADKNKAPLQFQLIGYAESVLPAVSKTMFSQTGYYKDDELIQRINKFDPHLILFPSCCPETYSYTLTAAMKNKRPVMVSSLGALPERVALRPWTWLMDWNISATRLVDMLCEVRAENYCTRTGPVPPRKNESNGSAAVESREFYERYYLSAGKDIAAKGFIDIRSPGRITALVLIENVGAQPSPCAYIRLILPLIREKSDKINFRWITTEQVTHYAADVLICHRTAVTSIAAIDQITAHCQVNNIRIVYDLDDLLLTLPEDHPEHKNYASKSAAIFRWLIEADEVWVSTETLRQHICQINPLTYVVPNYIDDKLWIKSKTSEVKREQNDQVRLLYMGTQTHSADFELVRKVLKALKQEFSRSIEINLIGISPNTIREQWCNTITPPHAVGSGYPSFVNWICNGATFDIGIAPLVDNEFNRCKSAIKYLDYSALGLATVASDLNGYALIRNGENGFRVKNTDKMWHEALRTLILDSALRSKIQLAAQHEIYEKYGYGSVAGCRTELLTSLLSEDVTKGENTHAVISREIAQNPAQPTMTVERNTIASAFLTGVGIEVGALHNPLPISNGACVRYVDRMDKSGLYQQYPELRQHNLVDVDFVDNGETLLTFTENSQDFIIANHFLEHCEDPIATLKAFFRVLRNGGVVFLALPDKRFTFDRNRQRTSLSHLIRDHLDGPVTSQFEHYCEWPEFVEPHFGRVYATTEEVEHRARELMSQNYSIHYHVWESVDVYEMLRNCADEQGIPMAIEYFLSKDNEMIIILRKKA